MSSSLQGVLIVPITSNPFYYKLKQQINNVFSLMVFDVQWDNTGSMTPFTPIGKSLWVACPEVSNFGASNDCRFNNTIVPPVIGMWTLDANFLNTKTEIQPTFELDISGTRNINLLTFFFFDGGGNLLTAVPNNMTLTLTYKQKTFQ